MPNLKDIRSRISSVGSTMKITNAMKMVSAAKLKRATDSIVQLRPYAEKLQELLENISSTLEGNVGGVFTEQREVEKVLLIVFSSNRGLCGGFNSSIIKKFNQALEAYSDKEVKIITIGKKATEALSKSFELEGSNIEILDAQTFENAAQVAQNAMDMFAKGEIDKVELIYNQFKNAASQTPVLEQMLPVQMPEKDESVSLDYIFEPGKEKIVEELIPKTLKTQVFKALLDSNASEHGARMTAMHNATDNAKKLQGELKLEYNKARQAAITTEILEIVGGAAALDG